MIISTSAARGAYKLIKQFLSTINHSNAELVSVIKSKHWLFYFIFFLSTGPHDYFCIPRGKNAFRWICRRRDKGQWNNFLFFVGIPKIKTHTTVSRFVCMSRFVVLERAVGFDLTFRSICSDRLLWRKIFWKVLFCCFYFPLQLRDELLIITGLKVLLCVLSIGIAEVNVPAVSY